MRYLYKQTGVVVESSIKLDSSIFTPASANQKGGEETEARAESVKKTARKAGTQPAKKTARKAGTQPAKK